MTRAIQILEDNHVNPAYYKTLADSIAREIQKGINGNYCCPIYIMEKVRKLTELGELLDEDSKTWKELRKRLYKNALP